MFEIAIDPRRHAGIKVRGRVARAWRRTWARMVGLGGISDGNQVSVYFDGDEAFEAMFAAIDAAQQRVWLETYIFVDDAIGQEMRARLLAAAERGCEVRLIYDQWGSQALPEDYFSELTAVGVGVVAFNPVGRLLFRTTSPLIRDHRKVVVIDDGVGFCGGMNISEDYAGPRLGNEMFRDTHARIAGPAALHLGDIFLESWRMAKAKTYRPERTPVAAVDEGALVQVLRSNVLKRRTQIQRAMRFAVRRSVERCWFTTPYFVPPRRLMSQLKRAARRGVDVRVLTAGKTDVPGARLASQYLYASLLKAGVRIYELQAQTLHAKTAVVDGLYSTVGSFNLDHWSYQRNLEVNVAVVDAELAGRMEARFVRDLQGAEEIALADLANRSLWDRFVSWLAYQAARL